MHGKKHILSKGRQKLKSLILLALALFSLPAISLGQELFPLSEPASTLPKGTIGIRLFSQTYHEIYQWRNMSALRLEYGVTPKLTLYLRAIASNHHGLKFPIEFPFHNTPERGKFYPYKFAGFWLYGKYRFLSLDGPKSHFRMSAYAAVSRIKSTHHESEPDLKGGDNSGAGFGLITTVLENKFAASLTLGAILPFVNNGVAPDPTRTLPDVPEHVYYGKAFRYRVSFGYRLLPLHYHSFKQGNLNIYAEFIGDYFGAANVDIFAGTPRQYALENDQYPLALKSGMHIDFSPGIQYIYRSNLRIDFSVTFPWVGFSYTELYPVYSIGIQRYFY